MERLSTGYTFRIMKLAKFPYMASHLVQGFACGCASSTMRGEFARTLFRPAPLTTCPQYHLECDAFRIWKFHFARGLRNVKPNTILSWTLHRAALQRSYAPSSSVCLFLGFLTFFSTNMDELCWESVIFTKESSRT